MISSSNLTQTHLNYKKWICRTQFIKCKSRKAYQFEREGYFCRDSESEGLVFNKTVGLRDTWNQ